MWLRAKCCYNTNIIDPEGTSIAFKAVAWIEYIFIFAVYIPVVVASSKAPNIVNILLATSLIDLKPRITSKEVFNIICSIIGEYTSGPFFRDDFGSHVR